MAAATNPVTRLAALLCLAITFAGGCMPRDGSEGRVATPTEVVADTGDCVVVDMAVSSEKIDLMVDLANEFNASDDATVDGDCIVVRAQTKASGLAAR